MPSHVSVLYHQRQIHLIVARPPKQPKLGQVSHRRRQVIMDDVTFQQRNTIRAPDQAVAIIQAQRVLVQVPRVRIAVTDGDRDNARKSNLGLEQAVLIGPQSKTSPAELPAQRRALHRRKGRVGKDGGRGYGPGRDLDGSAIACDGDLDQDKVHRGRRESRPRELEAREAGRAAPCYLGHG